MDAGPIMAVASRVPQEAACGTCVAFEQFLAKREDKGITLQPSEYHIKRIFPTGRLREDIWVYTLVTRRPAWANVDGSGKRTGGLPEDKAYLIDVAVRSHDGAFELAGWHARSGSKR